MKPDGKLPREPGSRGRAPQLGFTPIELLGGIAFLGGLVGLGLLLTAPHPAKPLAVAGLRHWSALRHTWISGWVAFPDLLPLNRWCRLARVLCSRSAKLVPPAETATSLPCVNGWIGWARNCGYDAAGLTYGWQLNDAQLEAVCGLFIGRPPRNWLAAVRHCDAAWAIALAGCAGAPCRSESATLPSACQSCRRHPAWQWARNCGVPRGESSESAVVQSLPWRKRLESSAPEGLTPRLLALKPGLQPGPGFFLGALHCEISKRGQTEEARNALAHLAYDRLRQELRRRVPTLDQELIEDAVCKAITDYWRYPSQFRPELGNNLEAHLRAKAWGNMHHSIRAAQRRLARESEFEVETEALATLELSPAESLIRAEALDHWLQWLNNFQERLSVAERQVLALMFEEERDIDVYARILSIAGWPPAAKHREVNRVKNRLWIRLKRSALAAASRKDWAC